MIKYVNGDIFNSFAQTLVNPVNTKGIMGGGLALAFKEKYPKMFEQYKIDCENKDIVVGKLHWYYNTSDDKIILNFPTKNHWKEKSKIEYIEKGLEYFIKYYKEIGIKSVAFPKLGCGLGGLDWDNLVKPLMEKFLSKIEIEVFIYI